MKNLNFIIRNYRTSKKAHLELSNELNEVMIGSMLGDLTAERSHKTGNTRLRFYMSSVNKDLIYHLYSIFNYYVKTGPKFINRKLNKLTNLEHTDICFSPKAGPPTLAC